MSVVAYNQSHDLTSYRTSVPQAVDPLAHLFHLEREMEKAERRTESMIGDLVKRLDNLEQKVSSVNDTFNTVNRDLEQKVVSLAQRVVSMTGEL